MAVETLQSEGKVVEAEFDAYAADYNAGMDNPLKRMAGKSADEFIKVKVEWLLRDLDRWQAARPANAPNSRVLEFGCGSGLFLRSLSELGFRGKMRGCDISRDMLAEAARTWTDGPLPPLDLIEHGRLQYENGAFDVVVACAVFHHVPVAERQIAYEEIVRVLSPGGRFYLFEHNPFNPVTVWVVKHTPIDQNAVLLSALEARRAQRTAGLCEIRTEYLLFFPPRFRRLSQTESWLRWLPLGGQYVVVGTKEPAAVTAADACRERPAA